MSKTKDIIDEALGAVELAKSEPVQKKVIPRPKDSRDNSFKIRRTNSEVKSNTIIYGA